MYEMFYPMSKELVMGIPIPQHQCKPKKKSNRTADTLITPTQTTEHIPMLSSTVRVTDQNCFFFSFSRHHLSNYTPSIPLSKAVISLWA